MKRFLKWLRRGDRRGDLNLTAIRLLTSRLDELDRAVVPALDDVARIDALEGFVSATVDRESDREIELVELKKKVEAVRRKVYRDDGKENLDLAPAKEVPNPNPFVNLRAGDQVEF